MITVVICGRNKDDNINKTVYRALFEYATVYEENNINPINFKNNSKKFLVCECEDIPEFNNRIGIFLFKNSFYLKKRVNVPDNFVYVFSSENKNAAVALKGTGKVAITYGMSLRDTLSITSIEEKSAVVSLQRDIKTINSNVIEPHEFKVLLKEKTDIYPLLSACAILLISGIPSSDGYYF